MTELPDPPRGEFKFTSELPDPYQPPVHFEGEAVAPYPLDTVGPGRRLLGFVIDYAAWMSIAFVFIVGLQIIMALSSGEIQEMPEDSPGSELVSQILGMLFLFLYYVVFEGFFSRTIGKMLTGTIVVDRSGLPPSFGQILGRTLARIIPFDPFSYLGSQTRGWHDSVSGTYVVRRRRKESMAAEV